MDRNDREEGTADRSADPRSAAGPAPRSPSRRRFLRLGIGGAAALGLGGLFAWHTSGYELAPVDAARLTALSPKEYLVMDAVAARMLRADGPGWPGTREVGVALAIDRMVARLDEANRTDLQRLIHLLEHGLPLRTGRLSRFTRLSGDDQDAVLASMESSSIGLLRGAFEGLKSLCVLAYFRDERTWAPIGYDGPLVDRPVEGWAEAAVAGRLPRRRR